MADTYTCKVQCQVNDADLYGRMKLSSLFVILQNAAMEHQKELFPADGMPETWTWMVVRYHMEISRMPAYGDEMVLETWPGRYRHGLFPRYFIMKDRDGKETVRASAVWVLAGMRTRKMVLPGKMKMPETVRETDIPLPGRTVQEETDRSCSFTVPYSYCDMNGHMNNTRYYDLLADLLEDKDFEAEIIDSEYLHELKMNETTEACWRENREKIYFEISDGRACYRAVLKKKAV
jgi:medium-chain acyl-[acyl-carrier-protein] hydrolase